MKKCISFFLVITLILCSGVLSAVPVTAAEAFTQWTENLTAVYHVGLSTATASDTNFGQYRYIAQPFVPAEDTVYGFELPLNITAGEARIHTEIRATLDGEALAYGDTVLARKGVSMQWYQADLRAPLTVTPGETYYLVYYLTARDSGSLCIAYGTDLGANKATYPGAVWKMANGKPVTFTTQNNQLQFGFKLLSRRQMPEDQDNVYTILAASDFQTHGKSLLQTGQYDVHEACTEGAVYLKNMMTSVARDHNDIDAFFFGGDLSHGAMNDEYTRIGRQYLEETMLANGLTPEAERIYITGNHETTQEDMAFFTASGGYDKGPYGLFVINDENHPYHLSDRSQLEQITKNTANELETWLNTQTPGEKPIFVLSHIQLHYGTPTMKADDGLYAQYFVDVLNRAGQKGHNIIFLFGHNHAGGYDTFLGGSTNFMTKGETLWVSKPGDATAAPVANDLYFTYMNYGYLGYYDATTGDNAFTMTVFEIQDSKVTVKRYDQQGRHGVQPVAGNYWVSNVHDDTNYGYQPDTVTAEYGYEIGAINGFTYWAQDLSPLYHVGLSTATASDTNWGNYRYIAQPFVPETETLRGVQLPLNITHGTATIHLEIRSAIDGEAIASGDTDVTHLGSGMQWYEAKLSAPATLQPGKTYYLVYNLTARDSGSLCIAYGTDLGANKATQPGAVWKMADGEPVTFTTQANQLHFGFKLLADDVPSEDQIAANGVIGQIDGLNVQSLDDKPAVEAARAAYNALTDAQKGLVTNLQKLVDAETKIAELMVEDQAVVDAINQRIAALPETDEVTYENVDAVKAEIMALDQAIMNLTEEQQQLLVNPEKIGALVAVISRLYDNQVAAQHVMDQIDSLTGEDADAIADARRAYDQLTEDQKALVNNLGKLETLENSASVITYGDVDGDGKASSADALEILKAVVGNVTLTDEQTILADVDGDEKISSVDALYILKKVVGKIDKFPVEQ